VKTNKNTKKTTTTACMGILHHFTHIPISSDKQAHRVDVTGQAVLAL